MSPVEEYILDFPDNIRQILKNLRRIILSSAPQMEERLTYGIPFFYLTKRIFYLNPLKASVDLGFCEGYLLSENPLLEIKNRSQVKTINYRIFNAIEEGLLLPIIHEAILAHRFKLK